MHGAERVSHYRLIWNVRTRRGTIAFTAVGLAQSQEHQMPDLSAEEFLALADMLRNERPIFWDAAQGFLFTGHEIVGEEELD